MADVSKNKTRKSKSMWGVYFTRQNKTSCKCNICKHNIVACQGNTSNLRSHLKRYHKKEYDEILKKVDNSPNVQPSTSSSMFTSLQIKAPHCCWKLVLKQRGSSFGFWERTHNLTWSTVEHIQCIKNLSHCNLWHYACIVFSTQFHWWVWLNA